MAFWGCKFSLSPIISISFLFNIFWIALYPKSSLSISSLKSKTSLSKLSIYSFAFLKSIPDILYILFLLSLSLYFGTSRGSKLLFILNPFIALLVLKLSIPFKISCMASESVAIINKVSSPSENCFKYSFLLYSSSLLSILCLKFAKGSILTPLPIVCKTYFLAFLEPIFIKEIRFTLLLSHPSVKTLLPIIIFIGEFASFIESKYPFVKSSPTPILSFVIYSFSHSLIFPIFKSKNGFEAFLLLNANSLSFPFILQASMPEISFA